MLITVVAFRDDQKRSVAYRNFSFVDDAVVFYRTMLEKDEVRVISTRKVEERDGG